MLSQPNSLTRIVIIYIFSPFSIIRTESVICFFRKLWFFSSRLHFMNERAGTAGRCSGHTTNGCATNSFKFHYFHLWLRTWCTVFAVHGAHWNRFAAHTHTFTAVASMQFVCECETAAELSSMKQHITQTIQHIAFSKWLVIYLIKHNIYSVVSDSSRIGPLRCGALMHTRFSRNAHAMHRRSSYSLSVVFVPLSRFQMSCHIFPLAEATVEWFNYYFYYFLMHAQSIPETQRHNAIIMPCFH